MSCYKFIIAIALACTSCAHNPVSGKKELTLISETQENQIGKANYNTMVQAQGGPFTADPELVSYVQSVGKKVALESHRPHLAFDFVIINDSTANAWALPGGKIAINRGLLTELSSEAELAAVLGHEIAHAAARHGAKGLERGIFLQGGIIALGLATKNKSYNDILVSGAGLSAFLVTQKYSRAQELEADRVGMSYMTKAGYDPSAAVSLQETFLRLSGNKKGMWFENLFASHPPSQERIDENKNTLTTLSCPTPFIGKDIYQSKIRQLKESEQTYKAVEKGADIQTIDKAIASYPNEALFWMARGNYLVAKNKLDDALKAYSQAVSLNDNYWASYLNRAKVYAALNKPLQAKQDLKKSISLLPTGESHELLGRIYLQENNRQKAFDHLMIASNAHSEAGIRAEQLLKRYF